MKKLMFIHVFLFVSLSFAQSQIAENLDLKKESLKENNAETNAVANRLCVAKEGFKEPKWASTKIRTRNKTRLSDLKRFVSKETGVSIDKIILIKSTDTAANGVYVLCVDGKKMPYKRNGAVFMKNSN